MPEHIANDPRRVVSRFFGGDEAKMRRRIKRALALPEDEVTDLLAELRRRHELGPHVISEVWREHFNQVEWLLPGCAPGISDQRTLLIGAYFTMDYALEAAAIFNPSIVRMPDAGELPPGSARFGLSLRAVGEGHLSSIVFRSGVIGPDNSIKLDEPTERYRALNPVPNAEFDTHELQEILEQLGRCGPLECEILRRVEDTFSVAELATVLESIKADSVSQAELARAKETLLSLVGSNYRIEIPEGVSISEVALLPSSANESRGIEDLRLVAFEEDNGARCMYGTYTAYNGHAAFPTLFEMHNSTVIESHSLVGRWARNKGMALFPRRINGKYVMSGRSDDERLYILESRNVRVWDEGRLSMAPKYWWEFAKIGNCGSPIETEEGWLMLTHGVGPMRQYSIGAVLLDLDDPARVIGRLAEPLMVASERERFGYVPNVLYTCGSMIHNDTLVIPYSASDMITGFATVDLRELLSALRASGP